MTHVAYLTLSLQRRRPSEAFMALSIQTPEPRRDRLEEIATRLRVDGIYVVEIRPGRCHDPSSSPGWISFGGAADAIGLNDLLDQARETARQQVDWVHAIVEDYKSAMALTARLPRHAQPRASRGYGRYGRLSRGRRLTPAGHRDLFRDLVAQMPLSPRLILENQCHPIVEFPEAWLDVL
jgi:hypothetical protein